MLMLCSLKGEKKNLSFNKLFCSVSMGLWQEAIRSQTSRCINCYHSLKKEEKKKEGKGKEKFSPEFFSFERWGLPHSGSSLLGWGQQGEITEGAWSLKLLRPSGLSYTFCLCVIGNQWNQAGCPTCMKYREAISFSLGRMILLAWKALRFGQKPSVETSRKKNQLEARMI